MMTKESLESLITRVEGRLNEFMDSEYIKKLAAISVRKAEYARILLKVNEQDKILVDNVSYFINMQAIYQNVFQDNLSRTNKDKEYVLNFDSDNGSKILVKIMAPEKDNFFRESWPTTLYMIGDIDNKTLKEQVRIDLHKYKETFEYFKFIK